MTDSSLIAHIKKSVPGLIAFYRFGSIERGTTRPDSDVDLVDLRSASTVMRMQVLSTGTCLTTEDDRARREFEMYAYSDYARLNEERREILNGIAKRGLIYG